jgi:hypothetical protein
MILLVLIAAFLYASLVEYSLHRFVQHRSYEMDHIKNQLVLCLKNFYIRKKLIYSTNYDDLTGIYNRRYFNSRFLEQLNFIEAGNEKSYLVEIDLDKKGAMCSWNGNPPRWYSERMLLRLKVKKREGKPDKVADYIKSWSKV